MKKRIYKAVIIGIISSSFLCRSFPVSAEEIEGNAGIGENVQMESNGNTGIHGNQNSNHDTNTNAGAGNGGTNAQLNDTRSEVMINAQSSQGQVNDMILDWITQIQNQGLIIPQSNLNSTTPNLDSFNTIKIPESVLQQLLNHVHDFKNHIFSEQGQKESLNQILNIYDEETNAEHPHRHVDGNEESFFKLEEIEKNKIKQEIARKEGLVSTNTGMNILLNQMGTNGSLSSLLFNGDKIPPFLIRPIINGNQEKGPFGAIRPDIIQNGFQDFHSWTDRFNKIEALVSDSNAMDDYLALGYIKDFHISDVEIKKYQEVSYTDDRRRWNIINAKTGESVQIMETDNPEHTLSMEFNQEGEYLVVAEQPGKYRNGLSVKYDVCEYLFDVETKNIFYFNEKILINGNDNRESVFVLSEEYEGWVPTGDSFRWNIKDLNSHEQSGSMIERIE